MVDADEFAGVVDVVDHVLDVGAGGGREAGVDFGHALFVLGAAVRGEHIEEAAGAARGGGSGVGGGSGGRFDGAGARGGGPAEGGSAGAAAAEAEVVAQGGEGGGAFFGVHFEVGSEADDLDDAAVLFEGEELFVVHVAAVVGEGADARMGGDDGRLREADGFEIGAFRGVGEIDHHAEAVHFGDDLAAEGGESVVVEIAGGFARVRVGELAVAVVSEREVAAAAFVELFDAFEVEAEGVAVFDADDGDAFAFAVEAADIGGGEGEAHGVGGDGFGEAVDGVELFDGLLVGEVVGFGGGEALADVDDEESDVHVAVGHFGEIDLGIEALEVVAGGGEVGGVDVVMGIEFQDAIVDGLGFGQEGGAGGLGEGGQNEQREEGEERAHAVFLGYFDWERTDRGQGVGRDFRSIAGGSEGEPRAGGIDDGEVAAGPGCGVPVRGKDPEAAALLAGLDVGGVEDAVAVEEAVEGGGDADAAFREGDAEAGFEAIGVGGVHLEAEGAFAAVAPGFVGTDPAEVVDAHAFFAVAADAVFVFGAFGAEVGVGEGVFEEAEGGEEVFEAAGESGGDGAGAEEVKAAGGLAPIEEKELGFGIAVDEGDELIGGERGVGGEVGGVELLDGGGQRDGAFDFGGEAGGVGGGAGFGGGRGKGGQEEASGEAGHPFPG